MNIVTLNFSEWVTHCLICVDISMNYLNCISQELQSCESFSECDWYLMVDVKINKYSEGQGVICFVCALVPGASQFLEQISTRVLEKLRCCNLSAARKPFYCYSLCSRLLWCCGAVVGNTSPRYRYVGHQHQHHRNSRDVKLIFNFYNLEYSGYFILISCVSIFGLRHGSKLKCSR